MNRGGDFLGDLFVPALPAENMDEVDAIDADGALDGGVAGPPTGDGTNPKRRSKDCDVLLYLTCEENLEDIAPNHPILRPGVTVSIGLDKSTKLAAVFTRYADFCNEHSKVKIVESDLEFLHCQLLNGNDTAEASALMKNDKIRVRRDRTAERDKEAEFRRIQRESDREYFKQLRHLAPDQGGSRYCDVVLDCLGRLVDENGRNQQVLCTMVRANSVMIGKRCRWLGRIIKEAREEQARKNVVTIPDNDANTAASTASSDDDSPSAHADQRYDQENRLRSEAKLPEDDDDGEIGVLSYPIRKVRHQGGGAAAEIENDDEDEDDDAVVESKDNCRARSPVISTNSRSHEYLLWVTIPDHSPEAVKLLLEYCYTGRVLPLGQEAFVQSCRTKPARPNGPVSPYHHGSSSSRRWPNGGQPIVSFSVALAGIVLAEESSMHRLSLMCEVAAAQLISVSNVVDALSACTLQEKLTDNPLPRLRQAAIDIVLRAGPRGVYALPTFRRALEERSTSIVPTLLKGTMEAISSGEKRKNDNSHLGFKRERSSVTESYFDDIDREDAIMRERERRIRRRERWENDPNRSGSFDIYDELNEVYCDPVVSGWAAVSARRSLKRMYHHLGGSSFSANRSGMHNSARETFNRIGYGMTRRRVSSRRRSSDRNS